MLLETQTRFDDGSVALHADALHLLGVAKQLGNASAAAVVLVKEGISRLILGCGTESENASFIWPNDHKPYDPKGTHIVELGDKVDIILARGLKAILGKYRPGFLIRIPMAVESEFVVALLLHCAPTTRVPNKNLLSALKSVAGCLHREIAHEINALASIPSNVAVPLHYSDLKARVRADKNMRMLLSADGQMRAFSIEVAASGLFGWRGNANEFNLFPRLQMPAGLKRLISYALETGATSPDVEVVVEKLGKPVRLSAKATPVQVLDCNEKLVDLSIRQCADLGVTMGWHCDVLEQVPDPATGFLLQTLLKKRKLLTRKNFSYVTLRSWRTSIKEHQIVALRTLKSSLSKSLIAHAGKECADEICKLIGSAAFKFVVPVPCAHSPEDSCLSVEIARQVAANLGLLSIDAFAHVQIPGSSHPKENLKRPKMRLIQNVPGPAILIDDVATSGQHLMEASELLAKEGIDTFAVAWIGSEG